MHILTFCLPVALRAKILCLVGLGGLLATGALGATLTSSDGKSRDFPVVVSAARSGLTVRESATGKDIVIPWARLDVAKSQETNPWLEAAREKALAGETVALNLGLPNSGEAAATAEPAPAPAASEVPEWRSLPNSMQIVGKKGNFESLTLRGYAHREVAVPRLAVVWVGESSPLAKRSDAADLARRMQGVLVVAHFEGNYLDAAGGSGEALVSGVADLLKSLRVERGPTGGNKPGDRSEKPKAAEKRSAEKPPVREKLGDSAEKSDKSKEAEALAVRSRPALVVIGQAESASFVWSLVCALPTDVMAAVMIDGVHTAESTAGAFATPCLFLESPSRAAAGAVDDLKRPQALWRHFSTDGCRWCYAAPAGDPLALAVAFARDVAAASPYVEALEMLESWETNSLRHRIPMPVATPKSFKENGFRLATPDGASVYAVATKSGAARNDLVWVPSAAFAARLRSP